MSDKNKKEREFREMKWEPGQQEYVNKRADRIAAMNAGREELIASGVIGESFPWGEFLDFAVTMHAMREAREKRGLSLSDVEARTGMGKAQLSKLENGQINPTLQTIVRYATGIGKRVRLVFEDLTPEESDASGPHALVH